MYERLRIQHTAATGPVQILAARWGLGLKRLNDDIWSPAIEVPSGETSSWSTPVVVGVESHDAWDTHRKRVCESLAPEGYLESMLAERLAALLWRLNRVGQMEQAAVLHGQRDAEAEVVRQRGAAQAVLAAEGRPAWPYPEHPAAVHRTAQLMQALLECLLVLPGLPDTAPVTADVAQTATRLVAEVAGVELASLPNGVVGVGSRRQGSPSSTVGDIRLMVQSIAGRAGQDADLLLTRAREDARLRAAAAADEEARVSRQVKTQGALRLVPDANAAERIVRYESHLAEQVAQTVRLLLDLRAGRSTGESPPDYSPAAPAQRSATMQMA